MRNPQSQEMTDLKEKVIEVSYNITSSVSKNNLSRAKIATTYLNVLIEQMMRLKQKETNESKIREGNYE